MSSSTAFYRLLEQLELKENVAQVNLADDWLQGRTAYGGLSSALCLETTLRLFNDLPALKTAQISFVGPAIGQLTITPTVLRQGKSTAFIQTNLSGEAGLATTAQFCFAASRQLPVKYSTIQKPDVQSWEDYPDFYTWQNRPHFMQHFDGRLAFGHRCGDLAEKAEMCVWLKHKDESATGLVSLIALADALPPRSFDSI